MSIQTDIGRRIRELREDQNFTQAGMAEALDLTPGAYAKIERGETDPQITRLYQIAEILGVTIYALLEDEHTKVAIKNPATNAAELVKLTKKVNNLTSQLAKLTTNLGAVNTDVAALKKIGKKR